jgi:hypothetical protein
MATDKLALYNIALSSVGERALDSLEENRYERRTLDKVWDRGGGITTFFLEAGLWNFAMTEVASTASSTGNFNFQYDHDLPSDFVRLSAISGDQNFSVPMTRYEIQSSHIWSDEETVYLRYTSNSTTLGLNYDLWPASFTLWAGHWLGSQILPEIERKEEVSINFATRHTETLKKHLSDALSNDAQQEPARFPPLSSWAAARLNSRSGSGDRGSRTKLTG